MARGSKNGYGLSRSDRNGEYLQELAFLEERLRTVEREIRTRCASLAGRYPEAGEEVREECRAPYGEDEPVDGLPAFADVQLIRFKRERHLLEWLRESVGEVPLFYLLWEGPSALLQRAGFLERDAQPPVGYSEEYWELRQSAETLRLLWRLWSEWKASASAQRESQGVR